MILNCINIANRAVMVYKTNLNIQARNKCDDIDFKFT